MIGTVLRIGWLTLRRDRITQAFTFLLPIAYFSIFATIFGGMGGSAMRRVEVAVVDEDHTEASRRFIEALAGDAGLKVITARGAPPTPLTRAAARELVTDGDAPVALVVRAGFADQFGSFWNPDTQAAAAIDLLANTANPVAPPLVMGLVQKVAMTALPDLMMDKGLAQLEQFGGPLTAGQRVAVEQWRQWISRENAERPAEDASTQPANAFSSGLVRVNTEDLFASTPDKSPVNAFYAASTAILFMLFTTLSTAGIFIDEEQHGTLERLLASNLTMTKLLFGRWLYVAALGFVQISVMFLWGAALYGVKLFTPQHLAGFLVMTTATAGGAAAFSLMLATACRTRGQLDGLGAIIILLMSAVGGCMFPRYMMAEWMQTVGLGTFNAWALDGYQKVFWYEKGLLELWPQVLVLALITTVLLAAARLLARRWETV